MIECIFDSSPLIYLSRGDLLKHIGDLDFKFTIPDSIYEEVVIKGNIKGALDAIQVDKLIRNGIILISDVEEGIIHMKLKENRSLSRGDLDVIQLACDVNGIAIMDETGRAVCNMEGVKHRGSLWVIKELLLCGSISKEEARDALDQMIAGGWYCSTRLFSRALKMIEGPW